MRPEEMRAKTRSLLQLVQLSAGASTAGDNSRVPVDFCDHDVQEQVAVLVWTCVVKFQSPVAITYLAPSPLLVFLITFQKGLLRPIKAY